MLADPLLDLAQRLAPRRLGPQLRAELSLATGPVQEDDQVPGDGQGSRPAEVAMLPSRTWIGSGSTCTSGNCRARASL
jgi:hypothetical protein